MSNNALIRVLIVDDSAFVRKMLVTALAGDDQIEIVGTASDAFIARDMVLALKPDVITLDIEMPRMDGITFLRKLMQFKPTPVIVISSLGYAGCQASVDALRAGAVEILCKPNGPSSVGELGATLATKIHAAANLRVRKLSRQQMEVGGLSAMKPGASSKSDDYKQFANDRIIAIGASTGGPGAVGEVLSALPANCPPVLVVQHMPAGFTTHFASRLNRECQVDVREAVDGDSVISGRALIAPGNKHMALRRSESGYSVRILDGPLVCFSRPSVDVLFTSVAELAKSKAVGVILTGMGSDGARGLLEMRKSGAFTIAQDEETCVVFGMPKQAIELGAVESTLPVDRIAAAILRQSVLPSPLLVSEAH